jgi:hypothetical protein
VSVLTLDPLNVAVGGLAQAHRLFEHGIEHRVEIGTRGVDDLQHVAEGCLARQRLVALGGSRCEIAGNFVEPPPQLHNFVGGVRDREFGHLCPE